MKKSYAIHGQGQGILLLVFLVFMGLLIWSAPYLDFPVEPLFNICGGK